MRGSPFFVRLRISVSVADLAVGRFRLRLRRLAADLAVGGNAVGVTVVFAVGFEVVVAVGAADPRPCADRAALFRNRIILYIIA